MPVSSGTPCFHTHGYLWIIAKFSKWYHYVGIPITFQSKTYPTDRPAYDILTARLHTSKELTPRFTSQKSNLPIKSANSHQRSEVTL